MSQSSSIRGFQDIEMRLPKLFNSNFAVKMIEFHRQDDGISMILSKQSESTMVGLSAHDERARDNNVGAGERPAFLSNQRGSFETFVTICPSLVTCVSLNLLRS